MHTTAHTTTACRIRSYDDLVAMHGDLLRKAAAGAGDTLGYLEAARRVHRLGCLYQRPDVLTDELRSLVEVVLDAIQQVSRAHDGLVADAWLDHLALTVARPSDGR
jgi:hypothetical protein